MSVRIEPAETVFFQLLGIMVKKHNHGLGTQMFMDFCSQISKFV